MTHSLWRVGVPVLLLLPVCGGGVERAASAAPPSSPPSIVDSVVEQPIRQAAPPRAAVSSAPTTAAPKSSPRVSVPPNTAPTARTKPRETAAPARPPASTPPAPPAPAAVPQKPAPVPAGPPPTLRQDLGAHHMAITTSNKSAQQFFDQGLRLTYGFNHAEAVRAFQEVTRLDPKAAMGHWGVAYALGPTINSTMTASAERQALQAVKQARASAAGLSQRERDFIGALSYRYGEEAAEQRAKRDRTYADAMRVLATKYPNDPDAGTLFAESLMLLSPWDYWASDGQPRRHTAELVAALERALKTNPNHPGACHFYIHAVEASPQPERAVPCAERLASLMPGAGHLVHMPSHIFMRVGRYAEAVERNVQGVHVDQSTERDRAPGTTYATSYMPHNRHFLWAALAMDGRSREALRAATELAQSVSSAAASGNGAASTEAFTTTPLLTQVRFGQWDAVLQEAEPPSDRRYALGLWHYARGLAYVRRNQLDAADEERRLLGIVVDETPSDYRVDGQPATDLLELTSQLLVAELAVARGYEDLAVRALADAATLEDSFGYQEPPAWPIPVRQVSGALLLSLGQAAQAETMYRADLRRYPNNGWSLLGLSQALAAQKKTDEAAAAEKRFRAAWTRADVTLPASRF